MVARRNSTPTPTLSFDDNVTINNLLDAASNYVDHVKGSKLTQVTEQIGYTTEAHNAFRPMFDVAEAELRSVNGSDAKLTAAAFCTKLTERGKVVRSEPTYVFPIGNKAMATILAWDVNLDHETAFEWFVSRAAVIGRDITFGNYVSYLKGYTDPEGTWYTEDGGVTPRGQAQIDAAQQVEDAMGDAQWSSFNFSLNLEGMPDPLKLAWIDAALHDLKVLRGKVSGKMKPEEKRDAKKLLDSNVKLNNTIGGDRITKAISNAESRAAAPAA